MEIPVSIPLLQLTTFGPFLVPEGQGPIVPFSADLPRHRCCRVLQENGTENDDEKASGIGRGVYLRRTLDSIVWRGNDGAFRNLSQKP